MGFLSALACVVVFAVLFSLIGGGIALRWARNAGLPVGEEVEGFWDGLWDGWDAIQSFCDGLLSDQSETRSMGLFIGAVLGTIIGLIVVCFLPLLKTFVLGLVVLAIVASCLLHLKQLSAGFIPCVDFLSTLKFTFQVKSTVSFEEPLQTDASPAAAETDTPK